MRACCVISRQHEVQCFIASWGRRWPIKGDLVVWWLILHAALWFLWGERNNRIFRKEAKSEASLVTFICGRVRKWTELICNVNSLNSPLFCFIGGLACDTLSGCAFCTRFFWRAH